MPRFLRPNIIKLLCIIGIASSSALTAQTFTISGISGLEFDTTGGDFSVSLTDDFTVFGIDMSPLSLTFSYTEADELFELDGTVETTFDGETIDATLDFSVSNESLESVVLSVSTEFTLKSITLIPTDLGFEWTGGTNFGIFGDVEIVIESDTATVSLGDSDDPGVLIENGSLTSFSMGVTGEFDVKTVTVTADDLTFVYSSADDQFEMYGTATTSVDDNDITISLGDSDDPGLILSSGSLTHINFGITADFTMKDITISPSDLTFEYDQTEDYYEFYGDISVTFDDEEIDASLGDSDDPGIVFDSGVITHVNFTLTGDITVKELSIIPTDLTFEYDSGNDYFEMYGDIEFKIDDDEITANMGDSDSPGLIYDDGSITQINIGITEDFSFSGLSVKTTDLGVLWNSGNEFYLYGDADLSVDSETVDTDFGTSDDPGLVIEDGSLKSFNVDVNSDLTLGNLEVETVDLDISYSDGIFEVTGELTITEVFSLSVTLGDGDTPGLEIDVSGSEPTFLIEDLTIEIESADLGTVDLKSFELAFDSNGITESEVDVVFASGTEIDAIIKFAGDPAALDEISITYTADNLDDALELFEGIQIAEMSGTVGNLTNTSDLYVDADLTAIFGGGFTLDDESVTLLEMYDAVTIDADQFTMSGDVNVGAYEEDDEWKSLLGDGSFSLDVIFQDYTTEITYENYLYELFEDAGLDPAEYDIDEYWTDEVTYTASVLATIDVKIPSDPLVEFEASVYVNSNKDFDALIDVTFYVPSSIPFIGGDELGSIDGAIRYKYDDLSDSYAAGWTDITVLWTKYYLGAKYKFSSRSISTFTSSGTISDIEDDISDDESEKARTALSPYVVSSHTFEVYDDPVAPNYLQFIADWGSEIDSVLVTVVGPEGIYELTRATLVSKDDSTGLPTFGYEENMDWVTQDTGAVFIIHSLSAMSEEEIGHSTLVDGRYQVLISLPRDQAPDSVSLSVTDIYQLPIIDLNVTPSGNTFELEADYWSVLPDSTYITFYANTVRSYDFASIITHVEATNFNEAGYGTESINASPDLISDEDSLYFFALVDDGINPPTKTPVTEGMLFAPNIFGIVSFPEDVDSLESGLRVFLDEDKDGSFDTESTGELEYFAITGTEGQFAIHGIEEGDYELRIVLPPGYRFVGGTDRKSHTAITFDGTPIELDLEVEAYTEAD